MINDPTGRVLELLSLLQTHRFWPGADLAARLEVSERTLRRDIDRLRLLGYPVDATPGANGGYRLAAGSHLPPLLLDDEEAVAIAVGLRNATDSAVTGIEEVAVRALAKLEQVLPDRLRRRVAAVHENVVPLRWRSSDDTAIDPSTLALLAQACRDSEEVRFSYVRRDGEQLDRLIEPHAVVSAGRRWYLVAFDVRRDGWRSFRIDRLAEPRLAGSRFAPRPLPAADAATFVEQSLDGLSRTVEATIVVHGSPDEVRTVGRWFAFDAESVGGRRTRVTLHGESLDELAATVSMFAVELPVEVEEPDALRDRVAAVARRLTVAGGGPAARD